MVKSCAAHGCKSVWKPNSNIQYHCFPLKRPHILQEWIKAVRVGSFTPKAHTVLCNRHFKEDDYSESCLIKKRLKPDAIPLRFDSLPSRSDPERRKLLCGSDLVEQMAVFDKNSDSGKLVLQPNETVPFTQVYIKEEQPEVDSKSIEENITYDSDEKTDILKCIKKEWEPNETSLCDGDSNFDNVLETEYTLRIKGEWESKPKDESEEVVLHEEIQIKDENVSESGNEEDSCNLNDYETVSTTQGSERQAAETFRQKIKHSEKKLFVCDHCDFKTIYSGNFNKHQRKHSGEKPFGCDLCEYKTTRSSILKEHKMKHSGETPFACDTCDFKTFTSGRLKQHKMIHLQQKLFSCNKCDYKGVSSKHLKQHQRSHSEGKPFACDQCSYKGITSKNLKAHQKKHSGKKLLVCDHCSCLFSCRFTLKRHQMIHSREKPFSCDLCGYRCTHKISLKRHLLIHSGEKPFACNQCNYKTSLCSNLKAHQIVHSDELPLSCGQCGFRCKHRISLKRHLQRHS